MQKPLLFLFLFISAIQMKSQTTIVDSIFCGGIYRTYRLYKPALYTGITARPLVFNLHGYTSNALAQQQYSYFEPIADTANFLMVYPQGTKDGSNQPYWNSGISTSGVNDIQFLNNLIDSLSAQYTINANRIYACGLSNGGFMSQSLACELSNRITAIASVAGSMYLTQYGTNCHVTRPVPLMQIAGTADGTVPYAGNSVMEPIDTVVRFWVKKNNCNPVPAYSNVPNTNTSDGCTAEHYVYGSGNSGSNVELYKVIGGGHSWPGSPFTIGITNQDFSASKEIWRFFNKYNLTMLTGINEMEMFKNKWTVYPNPANDVLKIDSQEQIDVIELTDVFGKSQKVECINNMVSIAHLSEGVYFISLSQNGREVGRMKFVKE